jgi:hypothetical protein
LHPQRAQLFSFQALPHSASKNTRGGGIPNIGTFKRSTFKPSNDPLVPLRPNAFGATIGKGTRFLYDTGKQLRSPRCLRIRGRTSGTDHRRFRSNPGSVGVASRAWVCRSNAKGVLERVSGFVLTNPELKLDRSRVARARI